MMQSLNQFYSTLKKNKLYPVYLLASDNTLIQQEARDALRQVSINLGFSECQTKFIETGFDWESFFSSLQNFSLLSEKTYVELHNPSTKFDDKGSKAVQSYLENPNEDKILVVLTAKLTPAQQKTRWYKSIAEKGCATNIQGVAKADLPAWIKQRSLTAQINLSDESIRVLAELTEGNLLATHQALAKLQLLYPDEDINRKKMLHAIHDSTQYNLFDLSNNFLAGQAKETLRCLHGLKGTGTQPTLILWAICRELRQLITLAEQHQQGVPLQQLLQRQWRQKQPLVQRALRRLTIKKLNNLILIAKQCDWAIKGFINHDPWQSLEKLIVVNCHA